MTVRYYSFICYQSYSRISNFPTKAGLRIASYTYIKLVIALDDTLPWSSCAVFHATFVTVALIKFKHDFVFATVGNELFEQIAALIAEVTAHYHRRDVVNVRYSFIRTYGAPLSVFANLYSSFDKLFSKGLHFFSPMCNYSYALVSISE